MLSINSLINKNMVTEAIESIRSSCVPTTRDVIVNKELDEDYYVPCILLSVKNPKDKSVNTKYTYLKKSYKTYHRLFLFRYGSVY